MHSWTADLARKDALVPPSQGLGPIGGDWLDQLSAGADAQRDRHQTDATVLQKYYHRHGLQERRKRYYRAPALRSCKA